MIVNLDLKSDVYYRSFDSNYVFEVKKEKEKLISQFTSIDNVIE